MDACKQLGTDAIGDEQGCQLWRAAPCVFAMHSLLKYLMSEVPSGEIRLRKPFQGRSDLNQ